MEKQSERRREAEPKVFDRELEKLWQSIDGEKKRYATLPRVLKFNDVPWTQGAQAFHKYYIGPGPQWRLKQFPLFSMAVVEQLIPPGGKSGRHRHFMEALFYIMDGEGYEVHDNVKYPWEAGDVMMVPTYCVHQHFSTGNATARLFFNIPSVFEHLGIASIEQMELHPNYEIPPGAKPIRDASGTMVGYKTTEGMEIRFGFNQDLQQVMDEKKETGLAGKAKETTYDYYIKTLKEQTEWRLAVPHVIRAKERPWENTRMGKIKYLVHASIPSAMLLYDCFIQEIPPGGKSGKHRHASEEVHKILDGKGYDIQDGVKWEWEKEDVVAMPTNVVHQHFNADPKKPATFVSIQSRLYHYLGHGGYEHLEDAPK